MDGFIGAVVGVPGRGKTKTVACPATGLRGAGFARTRHGCRIILQRAVDGEVRAFFPGKFGCFDDGIDIGAAAGVDGGVGNHRHFRVDAEGFCGIGRLDGDVGKLLRGRVRINRAVAEDEDLVRRQRRIRWTRGLRPVRFLISCKAGRMVLAVV